MIELHDNHINIPITHTENNLVVTLQEYLFLNMKSMLIYSPLKVSMTADAWSSVNDLGYMTVTAH